MLRAFVLANALVIACSAPSAPIAATPSTARAPGAQQPPGYPSWRAPAGWVTNAAPQPSVAPHAASGPPPARLATLHQRVYRVLPLRSRLTLADLQAETALRVSDRLRALGYDETFARVELLAESRLRVTLEEPDAARAEHMLRRAAQTTRVTVAVALEEPWHDSVSFPDTLPDLTIGDHLVRHLWYRNALSARSLPETFTYLVDSQRPRLQLRCVEDGILDRAVLEPVAMREDADDELLPVHLSLRVSEAHRGAWRAAFEATRAQCWLAVLDDSVIDVGVVDEAFLGGVVEVGVHGGVKVASPLVEWLNDPPLGAILQEIAQ